MEATVVNRTIIRYVGAFSTLSDAECDTLLSYVRERRLTANEVLFKQGQAGDAMVIVHHGALSVRVRRPDGYDAEVARIAAGEVLGELCCVDPAPRSASVVATAPSLVCELDGVALATLRDKAPGVYAAVMAAIIRDITRRAREVDARVAELLTPGGARASSQPAPRSSSQPAPRSSSQPPVRASQPPVRASQPPVRASQPPVRPETPEEAGSVRRFLDRLRGLS